MKTSKRQFLITVTCIWIGTTILFGVWFGNWVIGTSGMLNMALVYLLLVATYDEDAQLIQDFETGELGPGFVPTA